MVDGLHLLDFKQDNFLSLKVLEPTIGTNVLDLIFSKEDDLDPKMVVGECLAGSDHVDWCTVGANVAPEIVRPQDPWYQRGVD